MLITDKHAELLYNLIVSKRSNLKIHLPNGVVAVKEYNTCTVVKEECKNNKYDVELNEFANLPNGKNITYGKLGLLIQNIIQNDWEMID